MATVLVLRRPMKLAATLAAAPQRAFSAGAGAVPPLTTACARWSAYAGAGAGQPLKTLGRGSRVRPFSHTARCRREVAVDSLAPTATPPGSKLYASADEAVADIQSGSTVLSSGFGLCGVAQTIIEAMRRRGPESLHSLTAVSNNVGAEDKGGLALLTEAGMVDRMIMSYLGSNKTLERQYLTGEITIELCPQGTLAERIRAAGSGIPAFYTPTGANTLIQQGLPVRFDRAGQVVEHGLPRETRLFGGRVFLMETALPGDVAILRAWKADQAGNCVFRRTTKAFSVLVAKAARLAVVEAENIVDVGDIDPDDVHLPGIYVDRIVPATSPSQFEVVRHRAAAAGAGTESSHSIDGDRSNSSQSSNNASALVRRNRIARRTAKELKPGSYVNLGVGIPILAPSFLPPDSHVWLQSENGILGMGPYPLPGEEDVDTVNAGKETVTLLDGASTFDSAESFSMIRGGHVDVSVLGALQVSATGDLANFMIPGKVLKGMGGAMDLVSDPDNTKIVVATEHVAKDGSAKVVQNCSLPLTGSRCVSTIITDLCVFQVNRTYGTLTLTELAPGVAVEEVRAKTDAKFAVAKDVELME